MVDFSLFNFLKLGAVVGNPMVTGGTSRVRNLELQVRFVFDDLNRLQVSDTNEKKTRVASDFSYRAYVSYREDYDRKGKHRLFGGQETAAIWLRLQDRYRAADGSSSPVEKLIHVLMCSLFIGKHNVTKVRKQVFHDEVVFLKMLSNSELQFVYSTAVAHLAVSSKCDDDRKKLPDADFSYQARRGTPDHGIIVLVTR